METKCVNVWFSEIRHYGASMVLKVPADATSSEVQDLIREEGIQPDWKHWEECETWDDEGVFCEVQHEDMNDRQDCVPEVCVVRDESGALKIVDELKG